LNQVAQFSCITRFTFSLVIINKQSVAIVGVLQDDVDPLVSVMKLEKAPTESYADIGGLENQIQEIKVRVV
jgi:26S proteasome regulatory subunit T2